METEGISKYRTASKYSTSRHQTARRSRASKAKEELQEVRRQHSMSTNRDFNHPSDTLKSNISANFDANRKLPSRSRLKSEKFPATFHNSKITGNLA